MFKKLSPSLCVCLQHASSKCQRPVTIISLANAFVFLVLVDIQVGDLQCTDFCVALLYCDCLSMFLQLDSKFLEGRSPILLILCPSGSAQNLVLGVQ